ncbi:hypothetical protein [Mobiluncus curtisii]|uniref:hypothetical protein n=1 Tax=Mobiluncus curtisii TaxID=2051 RepID=UPI0020932F0C|nr:hypothetical protein [Mobiluncus curtisii]
MITSERGQTQSRGRKAYAEAQKEFDEAAAHEAEKASATQNSAETEVKAKSGSKNGQNADSAAEHSSHSHVSPGDSAGHENGGALRRVDSPPRMKRMS